MKLVILTLRLKLRECQFGIIKNVQKGKLTGVTKDTWKNHFGAGLKNEGSGAVEVLNAVVK